MERLRRDGLRPEIVRAFAGAASGPKWLALAGLDRALIERGFLRQHAHGSHRLLVGASAGAWRALAFAAHDPLTTHGRLVEGYIGTRFPEGASPEEISEAYRRMLTTVFPAEGLPYTCDGLSATVAVHVARLRGPVPWGHRLVQGIGLAATAALHVVTREATDLLVDRVLFTTRSESVRDIFKGTIIPLTTDNFHTVALASGTVPVYMAPVREIAGAPPGPYIDGGLSDYHLRQAYVSPGDGITLFPHYQERIDAVWFDGRLRARPPSPETLADVVQIYPSNTFVESLPDGRLPDRDDFFKFAKRPEERIRRWREIASRSEELGEAFLRDLDSGSWLERLEPMPHA